MSSTLRFPTTFLCRFVSFAHREAFEIHILPLRSREKQNKREVVGPAGPIDDISYKYQIVYMCVPIIIQNVS